MKKYLITVGLLFLIGCSIEPFDGSGEPNGSLYVATTDEIGEELAGATILLDGFERAERTPAYLHGVSLGDHQLVVKLFGYLNDTTEVGVVGGDTVIVSMTLQTVPADYSGYLSFISEPQGARLLVDGRTYLYDGRPVMAPAVVSLTWGEYDLSVHLDGYATISPVLLHLRIVAGETNGISFILEPKETVQRIGSLPFPFTLENVDGDSVSLTDLTGYVVLLNFWYADCSPCMQEFPGIEAVYRSYATDDFRVLAVNPMRPDSRDRVLGVRQDLGLTFQLLLDWGHIVNDMYGLRAYPRNILIDRTGTIHEILLGVTEEELEEKLAELL